MDSGKLVEFGEPYELITSFTSGNKKSYLYSLMESYGKTEVKNLTELAKKVSFCSKVDLSLFS